MDAVLGKLLNESGRILRLCKAIGIYVAVGNIVCFNPFVNAVAHLLEILPPDDIILVSENIADIAVPRGNFHEENLFPVFVSNFNELLIAFNYLLSRYIRRIFSHTL